MTSNEPARSRPPRSPSSWVPTQVFDLNGTLLADTEAVASPRTAVRADADANHGDLQLAGRGLPDFGPTRLPTLCRARVRPTPLPDNGHPHNGHPHNGAAPAPALAPAEEVPSGSALSSVDAHTFFARVASEYGSAGAANPRPRHRAR